MKFLQNPGDKGVARKIIATIVFFGLIMIVVKIWGNSDSAQIDQLDTRDETPTEEVAKDASKISITSKDIKEENFSGTIPVISGSGLLVSSAQAYVDQTISEFRIQADTDVPNMREQFGADVASANYEIIIEAKYLKGETTESIVMSVYVYTGGAHGSNSYKVITASLTDGKILALSDILKKEKQNNFIMFLKKRLNDWRPGGGDGPVVFAEDVQNLKFNSITNWAMDDQNLIIYFSQYEIGPGVLGAIAFPISLSEVEGFWN
jgi:hypothetical protein